MQRKGYQNKMWLVCYASLKHFVEEEEEETDGGEGSLIPKGPFFLFLILASNTFTTILSELFYHYTITRTLGTVILKDEMSLA